MIYMFVYSELHSSESFSNPLPTIILQQIWNWSLREWILCCCQDESGGPHSATGFQEELTFARNMSKSNSLIILWVLHFFVKKEKIQANKLLHIYTSYSATISRIWLILYKLYYCTCRNNLFCFKLILATLERSSICCREKKYLHIAIVNFLLQGMFSRTTSLKNNVIILLARLIAQLTVPCLLNPQHEKTSELTF